ncbi:glycosyltransferase [bacterium]
MSTKNILYISWQGAMGHITRDLAIARELHQMNPDVDISWMAHPLARKLIKQAGEKLLPESAQVADYNLVGLRAISEFSLNLMKYAQMSKKPWQHNVELIERVISKYNFDLVIGDEAYETVYAIAERRIQLKSPMIMIEDFIGHESMSHHLKEKLGVYLRNRRMIKAIKNSSPQVAHFFVGELEDVSDKRYGNFLPNRRKFAQNYYQFLGYIVRFDPSEYTDKAKIRAKLGYGMEPLVICATGGTAAGWEMLELCGKAYPILKEKIPDLRMVIVYGKLFGVNPPQLPSDVESHNFLPDIYEHYAASDLAIVVGGGTTTIELTALRRPFIFFPLENQFDQQLYIADRIARHRAGVKMRYHETSPELLAQAIIDNISKEVDTMPIPIDGAHKAAQFICDFLNDK